MPWPRYLVLWVRRSDPPLPYRLYIPQIARFDHCKRGSDLEGSRHIEIIEPVYKRRFPILGDVVNELDHELMAA